jgi:hypothetical protein
MRRLLALPLFALVLAMPAAAATMLQGNPELKYYADAYADHYGVPMSAGAKIGHRAPLERRFAAE